MAAPPSYEESASEYQSDSTPEKADLKGLQRFNIREEVGTSRAQHIAAVVPKLLTQVRERARQGLSNTALFLIPSDQDCSQRGQLVGVSEGETPILIQMEGSHDRTQFWTQSEALDSLQEQMLAAISGDVAPLIAAEELPERPTMPSKSSSFFSKRRSKEPNAKPAALPRKPPVSVNVQWDEVSFRSETEYGLFVTTRGQAVLVFVEVR